MSSAFFGTSDDDSEDERKQKHRQNRNDIKRSIEEPVERTEQNVIATAEQPADQSGADEAGDFLTEENELRHLRQNATYQKYASNCKRKRTPSPPSPPVTLLHTDIASQRSQPGDADLPDTSRPDSPLAISTIPANPANPVKPTSPANPDNHNDQLRHPPVVDTRTSQTVRPPNSSKRKIDPKIIDDSSDDDDDSDDDDEDDEDDEPFGPMPPPRPEKAPALPLVKIDKLPLFNEATLGAQHTLYVSCLALEPSGNRLVTGSLDQTVKLWDFNAMNRSLQPFRTATPLPENAIRTAHFSTTGASLLFAGGASTAVVTDRDATPLSETAKGDMYIVDAARTQGHTGTVLAALWAPPCNPLSASAVVTTAADATLRLWDITQVHRTPTSRIPVMTQRGVWKLRTVRGARAPASSIAWSSDGKTIMAACADGRLRRLDPALPSYNTVGTSEVFTTPGIETTSVACAAVSGGTPFVAVRSSDDCLRLFDERMLTLPVWSCDALANTVSETAVAFLGEGSAFCITGTSADRRKDADASGSLCCFSMRTLREVWRGEAGRGCGSVVSLFWHDRLNQLVYGTGDGGVHVLYHDSESERGILRCLARSEFRRKQGIASVDVGEIFTASSIRKPGGNVPAAVGPDRPSKRKRR